VSDLAAYRIIETDHIPATRTVTYRRSWRERLASWPWRPWRAEGQREEEFMIVSVDPALGGHAVTMNPATAAHLRAAIDAQSPGDYGPH
jgi:hypothetical protein